MRRFDADYLRRTRRGMWADSREALADLDLATRERVLDVGCGTGEFTRVLAAETPGRVVGVDADADLLAVARHGPHPADERGPADRNPADERDSGDECGAGTGRPPRPEYVLGDALELPVRSNAFDLVVCQALLINLPNPRDALEEFGRVSSDLVAAVEPDNAAVTVESTVETEPELEARARRAYLEGVDTDVELGAADDLFRIAGLEDVRTSRYDHVRTIEPPYSKRAVRAARRKATGAGLADDRETMLAGDLSPEEYDDLRAAWRSMGRAVVEAMGDREYRREETVPFYVTVGQV